MKVALLLFGQPRALHNTDVYMSHKKFILDRYDTDVYCHMWYNENETNYTVSSWVPNKYSTTVTKGSDAIIEKLYSPKKMIVEPSKGFTISDANYAKLCAKFGKHRCNERDMNNILSQVYSIQSVTKLVEDSKDQYEFIILARYDVILDTFIKLEELENYFYTISDTPYFKGYGHFNDIFNIYTPKYSSTQYTFDNIEKIIETKLDTMWGPTPECFKFMNYLLYYPIDTIKPLMITEHKNQ